MRITTKGEHITIGDTSTPCIGDKITVIDTSSEYCGLSGILQVILTDNDSTNDDKEAEFVCELDVPSDNTEPTSSSIVQKFQDSYNDKTITLDDIQFYCVSFSFEQITKA